MGVFNDKGSFFYLQDEISGLAESIYDLNERPKKDLFFVMLCD
jgi:hypothetical protein